MQLIDLVATVPSLQTLDPQFLHKLRKVGESAGEHLCDFFDQKSFFFSIVYVCMRVLRWLKKKKKDEA